MSDSRLLDRLAGELNPVRRRNVRRDAAGLGLLLVLELSALLALGFARPDLSRAMTTTVFWWKACSLLAITLAGLAVALYALDPVASPRRFVRALFALLAGCLAGGALLDFAGFGPDGLAAASLAERLDWRHGVQCVAKMVVLSLPAAAGLAALMRRAAPTELSETALAAGLAASAWGGFVFAFACPGDDPLYIATWYLIGCGLVTLLVRLLFPRLARW